MGSSDLIETRTEMDEKEWERASTLRGGAHEQSYAFGEVGKKVKGSDPVRVLVVRDEEPIACIQGIGKTRIPGSMVKVGGVSGGPVISSDFQGDREALSHLLLSFESTFKKRLGGRIVLYCPLESPLERLSREKGYRKDRGLEVYKVDLKGGPEELWDRMKHNKRRKIRQAREHGVTIRKTGPSELDLALDMFETAAERGGFSPISRKWLAAYLDIYGRRGMASLYFADVDEEPVSCALVVRHGETAYCPAAGSYEKGWHARPNDFIHWKIMEREYRNGIREYNMGGVDTNPDSSAYGVYRWKREYGGSIDQYSVFSKQVMPGLAGIRKRVRSLAGRGMGTRSGQ